MRSPQITRHACKVRRVCGFTIQPLESRLLLSSSAIQPAISPNIPLNTSTWTAVGPADLSNGNSGRLAAIAADPNDANVLYLAAAGGGVWKTIDAGASWTPLTDNQSTLFMGALAVSTSNPNVIYAGTGEATNSGLSFYGRGVLKSTDAGTTWTLEGNSVFNRRTISQIAIDPSNPNNVYVAVAGGGVDGVGGNQGIWKSTDGGSTWTNTTASISTGGNYSDVEMDPTNPQHLLCAVYQASTASGVYVTTNGGASWSPVAGGLPSGSTLGNTKIAIAPSNPQMLYVSFANPSNGGLLSMWASTNAGAAWTQLTTTPNYMGSQGWYDSALIVDPHNPGTVFAAGQAGGNSVIESIDGGESWIDIHTGINGGGPHADHHGFAFDAAGRLIDGNDGGIDRLENATPGSINWADLNANLQITQFIGGSLDPSNPNNAFAGSQDNGTEQFTGNVVWTTREGGDGGLAKIDQQNPIIVYHQAPTASFGDTNFFRKSTDGGVTWSAAVNGIGTSDPQLFYAPFFVDPTNGNHLFYGTDRLYESTNAASSWAPISTPGVSNWPSGNIAISNIAMAPSAPATIYATVNGTFMATTNDGATWTAFNPSGVGVGGAGQLLVDPSNSLLVYMVSTTFGIPHVEKTTNGGATWINISGNLPDLPTYSIALNSAANTIYVGTDNGVYASTDGGATWNPYGFGLPNVQVRDLELNSNLGILAAITHGRGMYEISSAISAPIVVNTAIDETTPGDGLTSLREAVAQANVSGGTITFDPSLAGQTITLSPANGALSIGNGVAISGPASRSITISAGGGAPVEIASGAAVTVADVLLSGSGTTLQVDSTGQASLLDVTVGGNVTDNGSLNFFQVLSDTVTGSISGAGSLSKTGPQTLTLHGTDSYTGGTTISAGTIAGSTAALNGAITDNYPGTLAFDQSTLPSTTGTFSGTVSGTGTIHLLGPSSTLQMGTTNGSTPSTFANSGPTVIDPGATVITASANDLGSASLLIVNGTLNLGGFSQSVGGMGGAASGIIYNLSTQPTLTATLTTGTNNAKTRFDGLLEDVPSGSGNGGKLALQSLGTGILTLSRPTSAPNTYSGGTTVAAGTLKGNSAALQGAITDNATLSFDQTLAGLSDGSFSGSIAGTGSLNVLAGVLRLAAGSTLQNSGPTTITGTLVGPPTGGTNAFSSLSSYTVNGALDLGASNQTIASLSGSGAVYHVQPAGQPALVTLTVGGDNSGTTFMGIVEDTAPGSGNGGTLALIKIGAGTFTLGGPNTFSGGLSVAAGLLAAGPSPVGFDPLGAGSVTLDGGNLLLDGTIGAPTQQIIPTTGYNQDVIAEASAANAQAGTTTTFDGNFVWYETGFPGSGTTGLPPNGTVFASAFNPAVSFELQSYTANNVALIPGGNGSVMLTLLNPTAFATLNFLAAAANGASNLTVTLNFADGSTATTPLTVSDWFNGSQAAFTAGGRIIRSTTSTVTLVSGNPRLYEYDYSVPIVDQTKLLNSITFTQTSGNQVGIYGLSGAASNILPAQSYPNAINVVNNATIDVQGSPTANLGALSIGPAATAQLKQDAATYVASLSSLNIMPSGTLDITRNTLFIDYGSSTDPIAAIRTYLANGYHNGAWTGTASGGNILSSRAAGNSNHTTGIGSADSADGHGVNLTPNSIELKYTLYGDANLDGQVNSADLQILLFNLNRPGVWDQGDFNYDQQVNSADLQALLFTLNTSLGNQVAPATSPSQQTSSSATNRATSERTTPLMPVLSAIPPAGRDTAQPLRRPRKHH